VELTRDRMTLTREEIEASVQSVPFWWHSIDLGGGLVTPGVQPHEFLKARLRSLQLPDVHGKTVLDIGAYDGFYSFAVERLGAARVVALDHYVWSLELAAHIKYWNDCKERGVAPELYHTTPHWRPTELPGKRGYDTAHLALDSRVETVVADFMTADVSALGTFDVVLFLGVLYHLENPLQAVRRVFELTRELAIIETAAVTIPGYEHVPLCEFYESNELNADVSNWWAPNQRALIGLCRAAGFRRVEPLNGAPLPDVSTRLKSTAKYLVAGTGMEIPAKRLNTSRYRTIVHAWK
jgi:tRNA (mo5U34)-methyltransferase